MNRSALEHWAAAAAILSLLTTVSCAPPPTESGEWRAAPDAPTSVIGAAGSTFVAPIMSTWIKGFQQTNPKIGVNYRAIGSGGGLAEYKQGILELAASDAPLSDEQLQKLPATIQVPVIGGAVCFAYNLPGMERKLRLSASSVAGIFLGTIINWQDPAIVKDNPGVKLPKAAVIVVHRSDGSGTTNILTTYFAKISPEWSSKVGQGLAVTWPVGLAGNGSKGVLELVKQTVGTIGYVELNYADDSNAMVASIQNRAGTFVEPTPQSMGAAIEASEMDLTRDARTPIVDPPASAANAYPVSGLSFFLMAKDRGNKNEQTALRDFASYVLSTGQESAEKFSFAKLPGSIQRQAQASLKQLKANGQPLN